MEGEGYASWLWKDSYELREEHLQSLCLKQLFHSLMLLFHNWAVAKLQKPDFQ